MASPDLVRMGGLAAVLGGALWALWYVGAHLAGSGGYETYNRLMPAVLLLLAVGLLTFYAAQDARSRGWAGRAGLVVALVGLLMMTVGNVAEFWALNEEAYGPDALRNSAWMAFGLGMFAVYVGTVLFGIGTLRAGQLPRSGALLLVIWFPAGFVASGLLQLAGVPEGLAFSGMTGLQGAGWVILGYAVWSGKGNAVQQRDRE